MKGKDKKGYNAQRMGLNEAAGVRSHRSHDYQLLQQQSSDSKDALNRYIATDSPQWMEVGAVSVSVLLISQWRIELVISAVYCSGLSGFAWCEAFSFGSTSRQVSDSITCQ